MQSGELISGFQVNRKLIDGLTKAEVVFFSMFWKPIGDSFLFLSVLTACLEYLQLTRLNNMPKIIIDDTFSNLIRHLNILTEYEFISHAVDWFKQSVRENKNVVLITDDDPFTMGESPAVFNTEEYVYPKFHEKLVDGDIIDYPSRPARYFLTFEREVGIRLKSDPNLSLPDFIMNDDITLTQKCINDFGIDLDTPGLTFLGVINQTSMVEKKFGGLRYLEVIDKLYELNKNIAVLFLANTKEESPSEWLAVLEKIKKSPYKVYLIDSRDFELLAYMFARCKLVLGNDTGFSHLAAMCKRSLLAPNVPCVITYSRHDYGKWSTGKENVYPVVTELSQYLKDSNSSISRDKIDVTNWGLKEWAYSISEDAVFNRIKKIWEK